MNGIRVGERVDRSNKKISIKIDCKIDVSLLKNLNWIRKKLNISEIDIENNISIIKLNEYIKETKDELKKYVNSSGNYLNKDEVLELLDKEYISNKDLLKISIKNYQYTKLLSEAISDVTSTVLISKSEASIYMYLYQRGWVFSKRISPENIFWNIALNNNLKTEVLTPKNLDKIITKYFLEQNIDLNEIISSWEKPGFQERKHIFNECIWALNNNMYGVAIPTLIVQIEGILYSNYNDEVKNENKNGYWKVINAFKYVFDDKSEWEKAISYILTNDIYARFNGSFLERQDKENQYKSHTNRNEILHGIDINYMEDSCLLKIIMLLDAIHDVL